VKSYINSGRRYRRVAEMDGIDSSLP